MNWIILKKNGSNSIDFSENLDESTMVTTITSTFSNNESKSSYPLNQSDLFGIVIFRL